ncbi:SHOCT domain-containing protein [Actinoplanes sp. NPDC051851]|uniref:SHOCT domain-containing protein n=1 Tax=Actinoplanes sp. NPDC051851 TaxID=3154753 RepID=UPI003439AA7C
MAQVVTEASAQAESSASAEAQPGVTDKILDLASNLASSVIQRGRPTAQPAIAAQPDVVEQLTKLASLRDAGILTNEEFAEKKAKLLEHL